MKLNIYGIMFDAHYVGIKHYLLKLDSYAIKNLFTPTYILWGAFYF